MSRTGNERMAAHPAATGDRHGPPADALVVFGADGEVAQRQVFPALYALCRRGALTVPVVAVAASSASAVSLCARVRYSVERSCAEAGTPAEPRVLDALEAALKCVGGDGGGEDDPATLRALKQALGGAQHPVFHLALPPTVLAGVIRALCAAGLVDGGRVVFDKPFGRDLASARALDAVARESFDRDAILRIDHFLGREAMMNLLYLRFANSFLEPVWNRHHVASVQVTLAESAGLDGGGARYDRLGCLRDTVQNHLLHIVALLAMEPPASRRFGAVHRHKADVFAALRPLGPDDILRGQYRGYRDEPGVAAGSDTETFCAVRVHVDSWRWGGVPWYLRAGKRLPATACEVMVRFKAPPQNLFGDAAVREDANCLRLRLSPDATIALGARVKRAGVEFAGDQHEFVLQHDEPDGRSPHERLLADALAGDGALFASADAVESAWAAVDAVLADPPPLHDYAPGSWGPPAANHFIAGDGGWHDPEPAAPTKGPP